MLMPQRHAVLNHDQPISHALSPQEPGHLLVTAGAGRACCRSTTEALQALFDGVWWVERGRCRGGLGGTALAPQERQTLAKLHRDSLLSGVLAPGARPLWASDRPRRRQPGWGRRRPDTRRGRRRQSPGHTLVERPHDAG